MFERKREGKNFSLSPLLPPPLSLDQPPAPLAQSGFPCFAHKIKAALARFHHSFHSFNIKKNENQQKLACTSFFPNQQRPPIAHSRIIQHRPNKKKPYSLPVRTRKKEKRQRRPFSSVTPPSLSLSLFPLNKNFKKELKNNAPDQKSSPLRNNNTNKQTIRHSFIVH